MSAILDAMRYAGMVHALAAIYAGADAPEVAQIRADMRAAARAINAASNAAQRWRSTMTPHRRHLLEMRAARPDATAADVFAAHEAAIRRRRPVERPPADATTRHLAEMRHGNKEH